VTTQQKTVTLRVNGQTDPGALAKSIVMTAQEQGGTVKVRAMGPHAVNQMTKAHIIARQYLVAQGMDLEYLDAFDTHTEGGDEVTVIVRTTRVFEASL
jgi:stage V sporulation protein SpoVS